MRKLIFLLVVALVAVFTNPSIDDHKKAVAQKVTDLKKIDEDIDGDDLKRMGAVLGDAIGLNTMEKYLNNHVEVKDFKVCSLTQLKVNGEFKTIGMGIFGKVFLFDNLTGLTS